MKMEQCSETSAYIIQTPRNYTEENIQHSLMTQTASSSETWRHVVTNYPAVPLNAIIIIMHEYRPYEKLLLVFSVLLYLCLQRCKNVHPVSQKNDNKEYRILILTEVFPCFFLQLLGKCQGKTRKDGARPALFLVVVLLYVFFLCCSMYVRVLCIVCFVTFPVLSVCIYVLNNCYRVATQLQLTNISYRTIIKLRSSTAEEIPHFYIDGRSHTYSARKTFLRPLIQITRRIIQCGRVRYKSEVVFNP
jgi:hypothetical protein